MIVIKVLICVLAVTLCYGDCAKILGIVPTPSYSHQIVFHPIWRELSLRGHQVTTITTDPINDPALINLTEIDLHDSYKVWNKKIADVTTSNMFKFLFSIIELFEEVAHYQFSHLEVQRLINNNNEKFDVVMVEFSLLPMMAFSKKYNAPTIALTSIDVFSNLQTLMGSPIHPVVYPDPLIPFQSRTSISDRVYLVLIHFFVNGMMGSYNYYRQQLLLKQYFGKNYPPITDLIQDISLVLANSDPIFHSVKPLVPTIVQFGGGTHRIPPKPLPNDLKKILDAAENGFIYFSLGSNVKSKDLSETTRNVIIEAFSELPYTVLWKFEEDNLPNKPKNVITSKWLPQQDILKHPKIILFITQGGLQSTEEAVYDHVPMLGMPIFADQQFNINKMVSQGYAVSIDHKTMIKDDLIKAILEVINNPKYKNKIKELAKLALDQPMTGLEKAVWWTEYVIRHNGTKHLRSPLLDIPCYQYYLLDVIAVFVLIFIILVSIVVCSFKLLIKLLLKLRPTKKTKIN